MTVAESQKLLSQSDLPIHKKSFFGLNKILVLSTSWYPEVIGGLEDSALSFLTSLEIPSSKVTSLKVSGSWELPLLAKGALEQNTYDLVLVLGCVVKGETPHFELLCQSVFNSLMSLQVEYQKPIGLGILTVNTLLQAQERKNKGAEAAEAALRSYLQMKTLKGMSE
jgi:6,7-dimethyl-8-ribityllumazine synthase